MRKILLSLLRKEEREENKFIKNTLDIIRKSKYTLRNGNLFSI